MLTTSARVSKRCREWASETEPCLLHISQASQFHRRHCAAQFYTLSAASNVVSSQPAIDAIKVVTVAQRWGVNGHFTPSGLVFQQYEVSILILAPSQLVQSDQNGSINSHNITTHT